MEIDLFVDKSELALEKEYVCSEKKVDGGGVVGVRSGIFESLFEFGHLLRVCALSSSELKSEVVRERLHREKLESFTFVGGFIDILGLIDRKLLAEKLIINIQSLVAGD